jgi:membrane protein
MFKKLWHKMEVLIRWFSIRISRIWKFISHDIWLLNLDDFSSWKARLVKDAKTVILMVNTFSAQKIGYQVTALAYRSMMSVVPAIAIGFYLTDGLGLRNKFEEILVTNLRDTSVVDKLLQAADNIVTTAESGLFGFISMFTFVWIVLALMITVRQVFNNVWKVEREPSFFKMIGVVFGITILSPFVVIIFFSGSVVYSHVLDLLFPSKLFFSDHLKSLLSWTLFGGIVILILHVMFKYIPGTHVRTRHSFKAAVISGLLFTGVQYLYLETQMMVAKTGAVYGALAAIPLFMIWLNIGWAIILYGAELSYAFQNVDKHSITIAKLDEMNEQAVRERKERLYQNTMSL